MKHFFRDERGGVVEYIFVLAFIALIIFRLFGKQIFYTTYHENEAQHRIDQSVNENPNYASTPYDNFSAYPTKVMDILSAPTISTSPNTTDYSVPVQFTAEPTGGRWYTPIPPYTCDWAGIDAYDLQTSCAPNLSPLQLSHGKYELYVTMCDSKNVCGNAQKTVIASKPPNTPTVSLQMTGNIQNNKNEVLLTALSSDPENDSVTYEWIGLSPDNLYAEGTHTVQVRAVDQYGAASGWFTKTFDTKEPIKAMFEEWQNYIITGASGQWKYDEITKTIYSTQNVDWTGYWNPVDRALKDYKLTFKMGVTPANDDDVVGMGIRMQDTKNMYLVTVDKYYPTLTNGVGGYHSGLYKIVNGSPRLLVDFKPLSWQPNQFMNVEIRTQGNRITVLIDGVKWADYTDASSPYLSGAYGPMTISQANGVFKDLGISQIK